MADTTGCIYGASATFKTWNLGLIAKYVYEKTGLPSRLVTCDGGGFRPIIHFVKAGIIQPLVLSNDKQRLAVLRQVILEQRWPQDISEDGLRLSGKMIQGCQGIGSYLFEGVTSISESIHSLYRGKKTGMNPAYQEQVDSDLTTEGGTKLSGGLIGGFSMDSYSLTQGEMKSLIGHSWSLPVEAVWWSGHEAQATDEMTNKVIRGIALVGQAATPKIGKDIGYTIHTYRVETGIGSNKEKTFETRYYFQSHPDSLVPNIFWEAKTRIPGDKIEELLKLYPGGYFVPTPKEGIVKFLKDEEALISSGTDELVKWKQEVEKKLLLEGAIGGKDE